MHPTLKILLTLALYFQGFFHLARGMWRGEPDYSRAAFGVALVILAALP